MDTLVTNLSADVNALCDSGRYDEALQVAEGPVAELVRAIRLSNSQPEKAKDAICEISRRLEGEWKLRAEIALAYCYSYTGEVSEGLVVIKSVLTKAKGLMRDRALLAKGTLQINQPLRAKKTLAPLNFDSPALQGKLHNQRARTYREMKQKKYNDLAIVEYSGAAYYFEQDNNLILSAIALNNQAGILRETKRYDEAHEAVDRAIQIFTGTPYLPQSQDQKCRIFLAQRRAVEALALVGRSISLVDNDRKEVLVECFVTKSLALAQLNRIAESFDVLGEAQRLAEYLNRDDLLLAVAQGRKTIFETLWSNADKSLVEMALQQSDRSYRAAAVKLGLTHAAVKKAVRRYNLSPHKARLKTPA